MLPAQAVNMTLTDLIKHYHSLRPKLKYSNICCLINIHHGISLSERKLKYVCPKEGLTRKRNCNDITLKEMVKNEMSTS